jgi:hypothetical protein
MNTIAKILAPAALVLASFGAQASDLAPGDFGTQPVLGGTAQKMAVVAAPASSDLAVGDFGTRMPATATIATDTRSPATAATRTSGSRDAAIRDTAMPRVPAYQALGV